MQQYGKRKIRHNFPDYHINGLKNWWEDIITGNKKKERSDAKKQIQSEIIEEEKSC